MFCRVLVDLVNDFMIALEKKLLKKLKREGFEKISGVFQEALQELVFIEKQTWAER